MVRVTLFDFTSVRKPSHCWRLLLAMWLLAGLAASTPAQCTCWRDIHTARCAGCTHLPKSLPSGVSRLNMTGNRLSHIHFATNVLSSLAGLKSVSLSNNGISALQSGDLCPLKSMMVLDLSANNLESVDDQSIACNDRLTRLVLNDNPRLQLGALRSQSLKVLYVENCGFTSFDHALLRQLPALLELYLRGNDDLPCAQVAQDLRKHWPHLNVHCDVKTTATKNTTTTVVSRPAATSNHPHKSTLSEDSGYIPHFEIGDVPSDGLPSQTPVNIQIVAPIPIVPLMVILAIPLIVILAVAVVAVISRCQKPGRDIRLSGGSGEGQLLEEPC